MITLFLLVMLGLYFGFFTPAEAGAAGSFFAVLLSAVQGNLSWRGFLDSVIDTLRISCMVIMIVAGAMIFGRFLAVTRIPFDIADWVVNLPVPGTVIMAIIFGIYIVGGAVMDALALLLSTIPIFFPVARQLGYDPIWFGVTIPVATTLGAVTPPVGATTYVVGGMAKDIALEEVFKGVAYFLPAYIVCVILLMLFVISIIVKVILVLIANRHVGYMVARVATDLRLELVRAIFASRWDYFVHQPAGAFTNAFATEAQRSANAYLFAMRLLAARC